MERRICAGRQVIRCVRLDCKSYKYDAIRKLNNRDGIGGNVKMKKQYDAPAMEVLLFPQNDLVRTSDGFGNDNTTSSGDTDEF